MSSWKRKRLEAMGEEDLYDVRLIGSDRKEVPCCKAALAMISPVFRRMFFKGFREQNADYCSLGFHSVVIRLIVKYCYCGEVDIDSIFRDNRSLEEEVSILLDLRKAGGYFEIEDLSLAAEAKIGNLVFQTNADKKKYLYAPAFLTEFCKRGEHQDALGRAILIFASGSIMECFRPRAPEDDSTDTHHAHPMVMAAVLQSSKDTYTVARCIQSWFAVERSKSAENSYSDVEKHGLIQVAENLDLKKLDPSELSNIQPSSFFDRDRILEAFVHNCKNSRDVITETPRTELKLLVSGEGIMEGLAGYYMQEPYFKGRMVNVFQKNIKHNGILCKALIHRKQGKSKWVISIAKYNWQCEEYKLGSRRVLGVCEKSIQMHVYKSSAQSLATKNPFTPPFNGWKCFEGADPVPLFACMYHQTIQHY